MSILHESVITDDYLDERIDELRHADRNGDLSRTGEQELRSLHNLSRFARDLHGCRGSFRFIAKDALADVIRDAIVGYACDTEFEDVDALDHVDWQAMAFAVDRGMSEIDDHDDRSWLLDDEW